MQPVLRSALLAQLQLPAVSLVRPPTTTEALVCLFVHLVFMEMPPLCLASTAQALLRLLAINL